MVGNGAEAEKASGSGAGSIAGSGGEAGGRVEEEGKKKKKKKKKRRFTFTAAARRGRARRSWRGWQVGHGGPGFNFSIGFRRNFGVFFVFASYREQKFRYFSLFFAFKFKNSKIFIKNSKKI